LNFRDWVQPVPGAFWGLGIKFGRRTMSDDLRAVSLLNPQVKLPEFGFFQVVKVKTTKEVGVIVGLWHLRTDSENQQWLYRLEGLRTKETIWWEGQQLRTMQRR
jgi:hypothetical protein